MWLPSYSQGSVPGPSQLSLFYLWGGDTHPTVGVQVRETDGSLSLGIKDESSVKGVHDLSVV